MNTFLILCLGILGSIIFEECLFWHFCKTLTIRKTNPPDKSFLVDSCLGAWFVGWLVVSCWSVDVSVGRLLIFLVGQLVA